MNTAPSLETAKGKLTNGWTMENLPVQDTNPNWSEIRVDCNLTCLEVVLLQNEIVRRIHNETVQRNQGLVDILPIPHLLLIA